MDRDRLTFFVSTARGLADLLADELRALGVESVRPAAAGVAFRGPLEQAYRTCLWSRTASRVLLTLGHLDAGSPDALYQGLLAVPWEEHLSPLVCSCHQYQCVRVSATREPATDQIQHSSIRRSERCLPKLWIL